MKGKIHALVGESGSGKSTVLKILVGLVTPDSGSLSAWKDMKIAYVSQEQKLFARTIRKNVTHSVTPEMYSDEDVWSALAQAEIRDWVATLPYGLDTVLEDGEKTVSGGQLQRLHLAHLFCTCKDADFVILDEALSAVDEKNREILTERLQEFLRGKTAVVVTHHSEILRICDIVHAMEKNRGLCSLRKLHNSSNSRSSMFASFRQN
jgi:ATP-binding cassette subfamily C protein CydC